MEMVNVKVNGIAVSVPKGSTILEAARAAGVHKAVLPEIDAPEAAYAEGLHVYGANTLTQIALLHPDTLTVSSFSLSFFCISPLPGSGYGPHLEHGSCPVMCKLRYVIWRT